jgi:hypothetical protein
MPPNLAFDATLMNYRKSDLAEVIENEGSIDYIKNFHK